jgi:hypothetical protein
MLELKSLKDKHKGQDIYVIGSGPSCNFIDASFFDNKISVGTNQTYRKFKSNYIVRKEHKLLQDTLNNHKGIVLVSKSNCGSGATIKTENYKNTDKLCVYDHLPNNNSLNLKQFDNINQLIVSYSTIITSIHLAYYLGAKNIILVGVDHGTLDGKMTFDGYYKDIKETVWKDWNQYKNWLKKINQDTVAIKNKMKQLGVNIYSLNPFINFKLEGHKYES